MSLITPSLFPPTSKIADFLLISTTFASIFCPRAKPFTLDPYFANRSAMVTGPDVGLLVFIDFVVTQFAFFLLYWNYITYFLLKQHECIVDAYCCKRNIA